MKRSTVVSIGAGLSLVGLVIFKNVASLNHHLEDERNPFKLYSTENIDLLLPARLVEVLDTNYLVDGSIFTTVKGVSGSVEQNGHPGFYTLSIAEYSKQVTDSTSLLPDSMKTNLNKYFKGDSTFRLFYLRTIKFHGANAVNYFGRRQQDFETGITFNVENKVIGLVMSSPDSLDKNQETILQSIRVKYDH